jgi:hypothetical protein
VDSRRLTPAVVSVRLYRIFIEVDAHLLIGEGHCTPPDFFVFNFRSSSMQSRHFVLGAAVLLAQLFPLVFKLLINKARLSRLANLAIQQI